MEFRNESDLEFTDISSEQWRRYTFPSGFVVFIEDPVKLHVSAHGHRIFDLLGRSQYVPLTWVHLEWLAKEGEPHFVK